MRVLVFGDSITQGYWDTDGGWVERVRRYYDLLQVTDLEGRNEPTVFNLGISADNSENVLKRIAPETVARTRHGDLPVVIIQIGVNDSSTNPPQNKRGVGLPIEQYEQNLKAIIETVKPLSSKIMFIGLSACDESRTTPTSWGDFYYTNESIGKYENKLRDVTAEQDIPFIPIFERFMAELRRGRDLLPDGLHPNNDGHAFMSEIILRELEPMLAK